MSRYQVNGSVTFSAWVEVEAETPDEAIDEARNLDIRSGWEWDEGTAEIDLNVEPMVEPAP
jgi:hypothetical protein